MFSFLLLFLIAFFSSVIMTILIRKIAITLNILDNPGTGRKIHKKAIPLLGGIALYISFFLTLGLDYLFFEHFNGNISSEILFGLFISATILIIGGIIDDIYDIGAYSIFFPIIAIFIMLMYDIGITRLTNPFGGVISLDSIKIPVLEIGNTLYYFTVFVDIFTILWLMGMTYTTKLFDGLDGLVTGIVGIGAFIIFLLTMSEQYYQPDVGLLALILFASCLGFLFFNFHPATIFLGEGGSVFTGFMLGVLAIISGGKIATALLVMGIPIMDMVWVILRRLKNKNSIAKFDNMHMHHRLLKSGLNQRQSVLLLYFFSFSFGITTLFLQSLQKIVALFILVIVMVILASVLINSYKQKSNS